MARQRLLLIAGVDGVKPEGHFDGSDAIARYTYITNNKDHVSELIGEISDKCKEQIGQLRIKTLLGSDAAVFLVVYFENEELLHKFVKEHTDSFTKAFLANIIDFAQCLWLVKDSDAYINTIYCISSKHINLVHSTYYFTGCRGETEPVVYSRDEIKKAILYLESYKKTLQVQKQEKPEQQNRAIRYPTIFSASKSRVTAIVALITIQQYYLAKEKFKLDLFEKRFAIFNATETFLNDTLREHKITWECLQRFDRDTQTASFLFEPDIVNFLNDIRTKANVVTTCNSIHQDLEVGQERSTLVQKELTILSEFIDINNGLKDRFSPYLKLKNWNHGFLSGIWK